MKRKIFAILLVVLTLLLLSGCGSGQEATEPEDPPLEKEEISDASTEGEEAEDEAIKSGRYELPCGMNIQFSDNVRNDVTGKWRIASTADSFVPADYALEYYNEMFSSDDEVHAIWNATLSTTTKITAGDGMLFVDTKEYVNGEEHDANLLFSGMTLDSRIINIETGEPVE